MRPGNQSNKRMRGRGRKGPNPLSRTYESNGPDVKIRGTALHVAEKYQQLARDAQASGDRIMSENYFQHAEHYLRIVAAAQPPQPVVQQPARDQAEESDQEAVVQDTQSAERGGRSDKAVQTEGPEVVVDEDSPQPFIEDMPFVDEAGQLNGSAAKADTPPAPAEEEKAEEEKPRRRARGTRSRSVKRAAAEAEPSANAEAVEEKEKEEAPKPKRRTTRTRRTKTAKAEETNETEGVVPAGE